MNRLSTGSFVQAMEMNRMSLGVKPCSKISFFQGSINVRDDIFETIDLTMLQFFVTCCWHKYWKFHYHLKS